MFTLKVTRPFACLSCGPSMWFYMLCFLLDLSWEIKSMYVCLHIMYFVLVFEPIASYLYLNWLLWEINGLSRFGGVICLLHFTILKMCVYEEYHLELILQDYLVSMWYVILMRNSNSMMSIIISSSILFASCEKKWFITLWGSNMLCAYYKPIKCVYLRLCHIELIL